MFSQREESPLYRIAWPRSMAFFGASNNIVTMGTNLLLSTMEMGFKGPIFPVHPKETVVQGYTAYARVADLPEAPDLAVMVLPTAQVIPAMKACGEKGIRRAVVVSGGFKEVGAEGAVLEKELLEVAKSHGIRLLGPNCLGVANPRSGVNTTFIPDTGGPGFIGLVSQSGSFVTQMFEYLARQGLGFSTALSVGNEADLDLVDGLEYLAACPDTKVIALYIEGLKRGRAFLEAAKAITPRKPIVAFYVGGSETGRKAGFSHTGSMAGPDELYDGVFRQTGVIRARTITELFDICWALGALPPMNGPRVLVQTHSGGPGAAAADACGRAGLRLPPLSARTLERLAPYVPHTGSAANPVDLTFSRNPQDFFEAIPRVLLEDEATDALLAYFMTPEEVVRRTLSGMGVPEDQLDGEVEKVIDVNAEAVLRVARESQKPLVGFTWRSIKDRFVQRLVQSGVPVFQDAARAAEALAAAARYQAWRGGRGGMDC